MKYAQCLLLPLFSSFFVIVCMIHIQVCGNGEFQEVTKIYSLYFWLEMLGTTYLSQILLLF